MLNDTAREHMIVQHEEAQSIIATGKTAIKDHKGGRLWLEKSKPLKAGFVVGAAYDIAVIKGTVVLTLSDTGSKRVAGKGDRPIIDLCGSLIADSLGLNKCAVTYYDGLIMIETMEQ